MGNDARQRAWKHEGTQGERLLLLALAEYIPDGKHVCWPSIETLAGMINIGERQTQRLLHALDAKGAITMNIGRGRGHTTLYGLLVGLDDQQRNSVETQVKGDIAMTPITEEKGDIKPDIAMSPFIQEKVTFDDKKVTSDDQKGDIAMSPRNERNERRTKRGHAAAPTDELFQPMFAELARVCRIDLKLCTAAQRNQVAQTCKALRSAGKLPEEIPKVETWWYKFDWRGKKGEAPRPSQIQDVWEQAMTQEEAHRNGNGRSPPVKPFERATWTETDLDKGF